MGKSKNLLTKRELEILKMVADEMKNSEIGEKLIISSRTVGAHKTHICVKLNLKSTVELMKYAVSNNKELKQDFSTDKIR